MRKKKKGLGLAFTDQINLINNLSPHFTDKSRIKEGWQDLFLPNFKDQEAATPASIWRSIIILSFFLIVFSVLFIRLVHLQIVYGNENRQLADSNRIQIRVIHAPRGVIYDRNGQILAENNPGFRLGDHFISRDEALKLEVSGGQQANNMEIDSVRFYPFSPLTSHILGYVGQVNPEELANQGASSLPNLLTYKIGDSIGRAGIEQQYEKYLRGKDGAEIIEVDAQGRSLRSLRKIDPIAGQSIYLSIDMDLQKQTYQALKDGIEKAHSCCGAAIVSDPKTGQILALTSIPSYDANAFTDPEKSAAVSQYFTDPNSPLLNRAIAGVYPPGSTFKIVTALAGLSSGKITPQTEFEDTGVMLLGQYQFANWYFNEYGRTEGMVDVVKAIQRSNDIFFYHVGDLVGESSLVDVATKISFGQRAGIDLPTEARGLIPDEGWKQRTIGEVWYPGDTLHTAIGQGYVLTTPLQILDEINYIAEDGNLYKPYLVTKIMTPAGSVVAQFTPITLVKEAFDQRFIQLIKSGLAKVPQYGGTAWPFFNFKVPTAGKTGTAEFGDPKNRTHAWYTSFAPVDNPQLSITVLVEAGGEGSNVAAPISKQIYTWFFNPDKSHLKDLDAYQIATASARVLGE